MEWMKPLKAELGNLTIYSSPPPGSGSLVIFMLRVLKDIEKIKDERIMWQRILETYKWAYARRTELGDSKFVDVGKFDHWHISLENTVTTLHVWKFIE